ncbi:hypothetical protein [uncultured Clostridium sp.]|uniref:hypothetical protein n=1 Tax=uncultured Clostridium sp. TaxID=59620 RepID=UPI0032178CE8
MKKISNIFIKTCFTLTISLFLFAKNAYAYSDVSKLTVIPGDIVITKSTSSNGIAGHAGIVLSSTRVLHIAGFGAKPEVITLNDWVRMYPATKVVRYQGSTTTLTKVANWCRSYYMDGSGKNTPYKITPDPKDLTTTYCSEIVWQSYHYGANLQYEILFQTVQGLDRWKIPDIIKPYDYLSYQDHNSFKTIQTINW